MMYIIYFIITIFIILILKNQLKVLLIQCKSKLINCNKYQKQCLSNKLSTVRCIDNKNSYKKQSNYN